jgi:hypothetical protein
MFSKAGGDYATKSAMHIQFQCVSVLAAFDNSLVTDLSKINRI